jgi:TatD DNase family protein
MFSDTHFHFGLIVNAQGVDGPHLLGALAHRDVFFAQDIGTHSDDLACRQILARKCIDRIADTPIQADSARAAAEKFLYFSAGIWPSPEEIAGRREGVAELERQIAAARLSSDPLFRKVCALGECGLDHHWNSAGADGRSESDFDSAMIAGEAELFEMQLDLARRLNLPVIVHSRDAFEGTLSCIKDAGCDRGIIHCYSYGIDEARAFLDRGWYISFSGSITYTKKSHADEMSMLLRFVPADRILLETDSPYLAPVPERGKSNTPLFVEHVYRYAAAARGVTPEQMSLTVDENICALFGIE